MLTRAAPKPGTSARRRGYSVVEVMVAVAIMSILIALLLPAIQAIHQQARSTQCANNLMQIGLALANYASTHSVLPPGVVDAQGPIKNLPSGCHHSWTVQILPYLGLENIYRHIDMKRGVYDASNQTALDARIAVFLCPASALPGPSNYAGCHHHVEAAIDAQNHGVLYLNSHVRLDEIPDGSSRTILAGEFASGMSSLGWASGTRSSLRNTGATINIGDWPAGSSFHPPSKWNSRDIPGVAALVKSGALPLGFVGGFSSFHPDGANFLFCDGSARFLKQSIDAAVYRRLGDRADGDIVGDDAY